MSRFDYDGDGDGMPWGLWEATLSRALGGRRGQEALAQMEAALRALPEQRLVEGHLVAEGTTCAVGALVAHQRAQEQGVDIATVIEAMSVGVKCWCGHKRDQHGHDPNGSGECSGRTWGDEACSCRSFYPEGTEEVWATVEAGQAAGLRFTVAWHLAYLNDEAFGGATPEERYERMLAWVMRAQGKVDASESSVA